MADYWAGGECQILPFYPYKRGIYAARSGVAPLQQNEKLSRVGKFAYLGTNDRARLRLPDFALEA